MNDSRASARPTSTTDVPIGDELIARAEAMIPDLRARATKCESERRIPEDSIQALHDAGLFNVMKPLKYGGYQLGWDVFGEIVMRIGRGCGSTGWVYSVVGQHPLLANRFGIATMDEIWADDPNALISSSKQLEGTVKKVEGGYEASGYSTFSSGCLHSKWVLVGGIPLEDTDQTIGVMLRQDEVEITDSWDAVGLAGTGSHDIRFDKVFVPEHRARIPGRVPPGGILDAPAYRIMAPGGPFSLACVILGIAQGALDVFLEDMETRSSRFGNKVSDYQSLQMRVGESATEIDAAVALTRTHLATIMKQLDKAPPPTGAGGFQPNNRTQPEPGKGGPPKSAIYANLANAHVAQLAYRAVDRIFYAAGATALGHGGELQRQFRDLVAGTRQFGLQWDIARTNGGRALLGVDG